jgi:hypothetical protein
VVTGTVVDDEAGRTGGDGTAAEGTSAEGTGAEAVPVEVLTDEELAILTGPGSMVVTPVLSAVPQEDRDAVLRTAYRGLLARGVLEPPTPQARIDAVGQPSVEVMVREDVRSFVTLRRAARLVVAVARTTVVGQDYWYAHVVDDVVLLEQLADDGIHHFALARTADLAGLLTAAALHPDCGDGTGEAVEIALDETEPPLEVAEALGSALVRADVILRSVEDDGVAPLGLFTGPGGAWVLEADRGSARAVVRPVSAALLRERLTALVEEHLARMPAAATGTRRECPD